MHPEKSRSNRAPEWFPIAVSFLQPAVSTPELVKLLGNRAPYETVKSWRQGKRGAPQWAVDLLAAIIESQAKEKLALAKNARPGVGSSGKWGAAALRDYHRKRALEREKSAT